LHNIIRRENLQKMNLPPLFTRTIKETFGHKGSVWLNRLPEIISESEKLWSLKAGSPFASLSYNYVAQARAPDGKEFVIKIGIPRPELSREIAALQFYGGRGSVRLIDAKAEQGILLLEHIKPGQMLCEQCPDYDAEATRIAASVMQRLWQPVTSDHNFKKIETWFQGLDRLRDSFGGGCGPFPRHLVELAESLVADFTQSMGEPLLLHGDLHHHNILAATREPWLAIDPKGVVGEATYEVGALLRNPLDLLTWPDLDQIIERRVAILVESLNFNRQRVLGWGLAQIILSTWWSYEDHDPDWQHLLPLADLLSKLLS
jgi:streptomycin 6-kinase